MSDLKQKFKNLKRKHKFKKLGKYRYNVNKFSPFWFQKYFMKDVKKFRVNVTRQLLNKDICIKAEQFKNRQLVKKCNQLKSTNISNYRKDFEKKWFVNFQEIIKLLKLICTQYKIKFYIFGGIINKLINPSFKLEDYDIDIYFDEVINLNNFIEDLLTLCIVDTIYDTDKNESDVDIKNYSILRLSALKSSRHFKGTKYFKDVGNIKLDLIFRRPDINCIDSPISNLFYDPFNDCLHHINKKYNLLGSILDIRHKTAKIILPKPTESLYMERIFLLESRINKYKLQGWDVKNIFSYPEVKDDWECYICFNSKKTINCSKIITFDCNHSICKSCLVKMLNTKAEYRKDICPYCRQELAIKLNLENVDNNIYERQDVSINEFFEYSDDSSISNILYLEETEDDSWDDSD